MITVYELNINNVRGGKGKEVQTVYTVNPS